MQIFSLAEVQKRFGRATEPKMWTAVIPAAGSGSRLGFNKPKLLFPIAGQTILDRLIDLLTPYCRQFIVILSPSGVEIVKPHLEARLSGHFTIAIQPEPRGMADAINQALPHLATPNVLVIWGDQVAINPATIQATLALHQFSPNAKLTLPLVRRDRPYVHCQRDSTGRFTRVLERREGAHLPTVGENDCGLFALSSNALKRAFRARLKQGVPLSRETGEWNFLPMLPSFETGSGTVNALRLESLEETVGVNDKNDVALLEQYFKKPRG